jgi:transcriptional regulator with XRE-family HTH domain
VTDFATNLRRLLVWHGLSNADLAKLLGATDASVSGWVTGKREPSSRYLKAMGDMFEINISKAFSDPVKFGIEIANPNRYAFAEENIARARRSRLESV